ncbi:unnamed protein product, partial [Amoebophrya sp. A25]
IHAFDHYQHCAPRVLVIDSHHVHDSPSCVGPSSSLVSCSSLAEQGNWISGYSWLS